MRVFVLLLTALLTITVQAASDADVKDYLKIFDTQLLPFFNQVGRAGEFKGVGGVSIHYRRFLVPNSKGSITIVNGSGENMRKYAEVIHDFYAAGYSVFILDHRGQGESGRLLDDPLKQYVDSFENFTGDLKTFADDIVLPSSTGPRFLLAHSMGGTISAEYLEMYPDDFDAAVLIAPMLKIRLDGYNETLALIELAKRDLWDHTGREYAKAPNDPLLETFGPASLTHSEARWTAAHSILQADPSLRLAGPTNHWLREAVSASIAVRTQDWALGARLPILVLQAENETLLFNEGEDEFCSNAPDCRLEKVAGASHEILMETDKIRTPVLQRILSFYSENAPDQVR